MHTTYTFNFLQTVSEQLKSKLDSLSVTPLTDASLTKLRQFQGDHSSTKGVYLLHYDGSPVYVGKANDVAERLEQHQQKLIGRQGIDPTLIGYKALVLDDSMSTAANEDVLIKLFKASYAAMWNGRGFGPKDPGKERDTTKPSWFDKTHPIRREYPVDGVPDAESIGTVLDLMKAELPYVFRFDVPEQERSKKVSLSGVPRNAECLLQACVNALGAPWRGVIISYGMLLYNNGKTYPHGEELLPK